MRSFREFLIETEERKGIYGFPNFRDLEDPSERPPGGYDSFAQISQARVAKGRKEGPHADLWKTAEILESLGTLAEQAASAIESGHPTYSTQRAYPNSKYGNNEKTILYIPSNEILGGNYPQIRPDGFAYAQKIRVLRATTTMVPGTKEPYYELNIRNLKNAMVQIKEQLIVADRKDKWQVYKAGVGDQILGSVMAKSEIPNYAARSVS
jgi:hypothetical protein